MKKLNLHEMYVFGKRLEPISHITNDTKISDLSFDLYFARATLKGLVDDASPLLSTARRAAGKMIEAINTVLPDDLKDVVGIDKEKKFNWNAGGITKSLSDLESVLGNEMPDIAAYIVSQKGIYRTADLIEHAENHLTTDVRSILPKQACFDLQQAGKCLAYELATACTFHLWRAVETMTEEYYRALTGKSFDAAGVQLNWGQYIIALNKAKAESKITVFLDHIRGEYRNPQTHPDAEIKIDEAQRLFGVACSSIDQMALAIQILRKSMATDASVSPIVHARGILPVVSSGLSANESEGVTGVPKTRPKS